MIFEAELGLHDHVEVTDRYIEVEGPAIGLGGIQVATEVEWWGIKL